MTGALVAFNDAMLKPGQYSREDIEEIGSVQNLYVSLEQRAEILARAARDGSVRDAEVQFKRKDGSAYDALISLIRHEVGGQSFWQATVEDVTERKKVEAELRESNLRFRMLEETIRDVFYIATIDPKKMLYVSPAYEELWGRSCESLYREPLSWLESIHPED